MKWGENCNYEINYSSGRGYHTILTATIFGHFYAKHIWLIKLALATLHSTTVLRCHFSRSDLRLNLLHQSIIWIWWSRSIGIEFIRPGPLRLYFRVIRPSHHAIQLPFLYFPQKVHEHDEKTRENYWSQGKSDKSLPLMTGGCREWPWAPMTVWLTNFQKPSWFPIWILSISVSPTFGEKNARDGR